MTPRRWLIVASILLTGLGLRLAILLTLEGQPLIAEPILDMLSYDRWARRLASEGFLGEGVFYQDPLYPYALGAFYRLFGRDLMAVKIVQACLGVLGLWFLFEAVRRLEGYAPAIATLALGALYETTAFYDVVLLKEFLGPFFIAGTLAAVTLGTTTGKRRWWLLAGGALGLGALVRGNLLILPPLLAVWLWATRARRAAALLLAGAALAIAPCTARNLVVGGELVLTTAQFGPNLYTGNNPDNWTGRYLQTPFMEAGSPLFEESAFRREAARRTGSPSLSAGEVSTFWRNEALRAIANEPAGFALATFRRLMLLTSAWEVPDNVDVAFMSRFSPVLALPWPGFGLVWPLAAGGLVLCWRDRSRHAAAYILLAGVSVPIVFFFVFDRYRLPAIPLLLAFAGTGIVRGWKAFRAGRRSLWPAACVTAVLLVHCHLPARLYGVGDTSFSDSHFNLAIWHRKHGDPGAAVREIERAFAASPPDQRDDTEMALFAAYACAAAGRYDEASRWFVRAGAEELSAESLAVAESRRPPVAFWQAAVLANPWHLGLGLDLAREQARSGRPSDAVVTLRRLAELHPDDPAPWLHLARLQLSFGLRSEAAAAAREALARDPGGLAEAAAILTETGGSPPTPGASP